MTMHTTTVRFDPETWARLKLATNDLGIATADYIRAATVQRLERTAYEARVLALESRVLLGTSGSLVSRLDPLSFKSLSRSSSAARRVHRLQSTHVG